MKKIIILACSAIVFAACDKVHDKAKDSIEEGSAAVEKTADKVVDEVSAQFEDNRGCTITLSEELKAKGFNTGKFYIEKDTVTRKHNKLVVYIINDKNQSAVLNFKVNDKKGVEIGRSSVDVGAKTQTSGYFDVIFDKRTDIERKSVISIY